MDNLINDRVLITGATKGIGLACVGKFLEHSCDVAALGRDFSQFKYDCERIECDLSDPQTLSNTLNEFPERVGTLVLNAGVGLFGGLEQMSLAQIQSILNVNLISGLVLIKHYLPQMKRDGGGDIVLIGSESALQGARAGTVYCASKFAVRGLAQSLRADCSTSNVRVHLINPGPVDTSFFEDLAFEPQRGQEFVLNPDDVASTVVHALSQPRHVVTEEINVQPMKRSFQKKIKR